MSDELKPCPFCGANDASLSFDEIVSCSNCGATANNKIDWNLRATPSPEQSDRERAERAWNDWSITEPLNRRNLYEFLASAFTQIRVEERERAISEIEKRRVPNTEGAESDGLDAMQRAMRAWASQELAVVRDAIRGLK